MNGALLLVGIGPGDPRQMTGRALDALASADVVFGYSAYLDLLRPVLPGLDYRPSAITQEELRARTAVDLALAGRRVALVGSGDAGVYGLAGLAFEILEERGATELAVEVVPGVTAALSAAALLGAPLGHDFACISLSDLLTPWETIHLRLEAAAIADFVMVLYNPQSARRTRPFAEACAILLRHRAPETPVGLVRNGYRADQRVTLTTLAELAGAPVDMLTTVVIGNSSTRRWQQRLITPRGYLTPSTSPEGEQPADSPRQQPADADTAVASSDAAPSNAEAPVATIPALYRPGAGSGAADVVLLVGHGTRDAEGLAQYHVFARELARTSGETVVPACLEINDPDIPTALAQAIEGGARHLTVLPLLLGAATHQKNDIPTALAWARTRYPNASFSYGTPLGAHAALATALADRAAEALVVSESAVAADESAVLLIGRGSSDPDSNSDLYKMGRLLYEGRDWGWVECCFVAMAEPDVATGVDRCVRLGARRIVLLPYMLFTGVLDRRVQTLAAELRGRYPAVELLAAAPLGAHPQVLSVALQRIAEARTGEAHANCDACRYRVRMAGFETDLGRPQGSDAHHGLRGTGITPPGGHGNGHSHGDSALSRPGA
jgi:precorrin-3B C17-methyltransferase